MSYICKYNHTRTDTHTDIHIHTQSCSIEGPSLFRPRFFPGRFDLHYMIVKPQTHARKHTHTHTHTHTRKHTHTHANTHTHTHTHEHTFIIQPHSQGNMTRSGTDSSPVVSPSIKANSPPLASLPSAPSSFTPQLYTRPPSTRARECIPPHCVRECIRVCGCVYKNIHAGMCVCLFIYVNVYDASVTVLRLAK